MIHPPELSRRAQRRRPVLAIALATWLASGVHGDWTIETVDSAGTVGDHTSLVLDSDGNPHISYRAYDAATSTYFLKHASVDVLSGAWETETVDAPSDASVGSYSSICMDPDDRVFIAYLDSTNQDLKLAQKNPGEGWQVQQAGIDDNVEDTGCPHRLLRRDERCAETRDAGPEAREWTADLGMVPLDGG